MPLKPFKVPQRSVKIEIKVSSSSCCASFCFNARRLVKLIIFLEKRLKKKSCNLFEWLKSSYFKIKLKTFVTSQNEIKENFVKRNSTKGLKLEIKHVSSLELLLSAAIFSVILVDNHHFLIHDFGFLNICSKLLLLS